MNRLPWPLRWCALLFPLSFGPPNRALRSRPATFGVDRVLYAMDYPYQFVPEEVKVTDELPIPDADKEKLYQLNAERVFHL